MPRVLIGSIAPSRASISFAALFVKVTARMPCGVVCPVETSHAMRVVSTRVLPEPAPARISAGCGGSVTAASCSGLRLSSRAMAGIYGAIRDFTAVGPQARKDTGRHARRPATPPSGLLSDDVVDHQQDDRADDRADEARALPCLVDPERLSAVGGEQRAADTEQDRH